jgi:CubicO group peptidase (beta-lactamase class C family)
MSIEPGTAHHLHHLLATEQSRSRLPSVAAGIVRSGALVWADAVGTLDGRADGEAADTDTQYRIGSITKTLIGVEVMRLRARAGWAWRTTSTSTSPARSSAARRSPSCCRTGRASKRRRTVLGGSGRPVATGTSS